MGPTMDKRSPATGSVAHGERGGAEQNAHGAGRGGGRVLDHPAKRDAQGRLPANHQAERSLLGSMLIAPDEVLDRARTEFGISADSFDDLAHSRVWRSAEELVAASVPLTIETVTNHLYERSEEHTSELQSPVHL